MHSPAQGKDYEIKDKEAVEISPSGVEEMVMATDAKYRVLKIPAAEPGKYRLRNREGTEALHPAGLVEFSGAHPDPGSPIHLAVAARVGNTRRSGSITQMSSRPRLEQISGNGS